LSQIRGAAATKKRAAPALKIRRSKAGLSNYPYRDRFKIALKMNISFYDTL
jgi:hypothetical protein